MVIQKTVRDGKVAVLTSPGYGAGWSTWNDQQFSEILLFHPKLVEMIEAGNRDNITEAWIVETLGLEDLYLGGADTLHIVWLPVGTQFRVEEYDGSESIITLEHLTFTA